MVKTFSLGGLAARCAIQAPILKWMSVYSPTMKQKDQKPTQRLRQPDYPLTAQPSWSPWSHLSKQSLKFLSTPPCRQARQRAEGWRCDQSQGLSQHLRADLWCVGRKSKRKRRPQDLKRGSTKSLRVSFKIRIVGGQLLTVLAPSFLARVAKSLFKPKSTFSCSAVPPASARVVPRQDT